MRGHHRAYIDYCNTMVPPFYVKTGRKEWTLTRHVVFQTPFGAMAAPRGMSTDLFSCVPDTSYLRFHMASVLHDFARKRVPRRRADAMFANEMNNAISDIVQWLRETECEAKVIEKEAVRLYRLSAMYSLGVSGILGSAYIALDKIKLF